MSQPLLGVRVIDLTRLLPGAYATLLLANLGAEVIKVEDPHGGDGMRGLGARLKPSHYVDPTTSYFDLLNGGKRSVTLDLRHADATPVLDALLARADAVVDSFRPSTARRLGVDAGTLRARHPRLICASITGFGRPGPYTEVAAHDINYQALAGLLDPPAMPGPLIGDIGAAMQTAIGILAALIERQHTGEGSVVEVQIHEAALAWSMFPTSSDLESACYTMYETADGEWLALGALESKFWRGFCERIGRADLIPLQHATGEEGARVMAEVRAILGSRPRAEWLAMFADADVCLTPIHTPAEVAVDPHLVSRRGRVKPDITNERRIAPGLGADTDAVLEESGVGSDQRARLRSRGLI
ncbi:MAG TPA: CaiB/BaiF CoA-transferase family protein [Vicinamibacterales bacterium]|nr:CaiB/BaiF CoA-transferase family protein [Vicinamibacterales bacterium]